MFRTKEDVVRKYTLAKAKVCPNINGYQTSILDNIEVQRKKICEYRIKIFFSDTPPKATPSNYPYVVFGNLVKLNDIYRPLFPNGDIPLLSKEKSDKLCATEFGFDKNSGFPCRIFRCGEEIKIMIYPPEGEPYEMDCFTGLKAEK